jgi:hypothetical protein
MELNNIPVIQEGLSIYKKMIIFNPKKLKTKNNLIANNCLNKWEYQMLKLKHIN